MQRTHQCTPPVQLHLMLPPHKTVWQQDQAPPSIRRQIWLSLIDMMHGVDSMTRWQCPKAVAQGWNDTPDLVLTRVTAGRGF